MTVESVADKPQHQKLTATTEMIAHRVMALEKIRKLNPYRDITDPVDWQREMRDERPLSGREWREHANND